MAAPLSVPMRHTTTSMLEAAIEEAREAVDAAEDHQQLRSLFDNILTTLADPDAHRETVSGILAGFRDGASLSALKRAIKQFLNRLEPAEGGSKASGYVRLLLARHVVGRKEEDYDPMPRKKKMAGDFALSKVRNPSEPLRELLKYRAQRSKFPFLKEGAPAPAPAPAPTTSTRRRFRQTDAGRIYDETPEERMAKREAARAKERKHTEELMADYKNLTYPERAGMFSSMETLGIPIPANMKRAYDNWAKKGRPARGKGMYPDEEEVGGVRLDLGKAMARLATPVETFKDLAKSGRERRGDILDRRIKKLEEEVKGAYYDPAAIMRSVEEEAHRRKMARVPSKVGKGMSGGRYKLRKAPGRPLFWVVGEDGKHHSKDPLPRERAEKQMRALYAAMKDE